MKFYNKLMRKKRAVSPIIAAILLIGLAVLAGAAIFVVVLPMLQSGTNASQVAIDWSGTGVATVTNSGAQSTASFSVTVSNSGTAAISIKLTDVSITNSTVTSPLSANTITAKVGSTDAVANTVNVPAGQTVTVVITATWGSTHVKSADLSVTFNAGSVGTVSNTFAGKIA